MSTSIRGDDSFWAETNAAVDGARAHLSWSGGGVQVFPLHSSRCWKTIILYCTCTKQLSKAHLLFFFPSFFWGVWTRTTNDEQKGEQKNSKRERATRRIIVSSRRTSKDFCANTVTHRARERERERTGEENTRSPFRIIIIIIIQHHQTLRRSFVEWWCFSA